MASSWGNSWSTHWLTHWNRGGVTPPPPPPPSRPALDSGELHRRREQEEYALLYAIRQRHEAKRRAAQELEEALKLKASAETVEAAAAQLREEQPESDAEAAQRAELFTVINRMNAVEEAAQKATARIAALQILYEMQVRLRDDEDAIIVILMCV